MVKYADPPEGWKYGFPTIDDHKEKYPHLTREEWYIEKGYPRKLIDEGMLAYCRGWIEDDKDISNQ